MADFDGNFGHLNFEVEKWSIKEKNVQNCPRNLMEFPTSGHLKRVSENMGKTSKKPAKMAKTERPKWGARL